MNNSCNTDAPAAENAGESFIKKTEAAYERISEALSRFAAKKYALPVFILIAFFGFFITALIGGYNVFGFDAEIQFTFYQFYLCDFSAGFCSRVIVGAVTSLFFDKISVAQMTTIANAAVAVSFALFAVIIGAVLRKGIRERAFVPVLLAVVLMFEPVVVQSNYMFVGTLDVYSLIIFLITLCTFGTPLFYIAAPVLSLLGMSVHYHYMFSFFPAVIAMYVYGMFLGEKKSKRILNTVGMCTAALSGTGLFIWFVFFAKDHLKCTADEFYELMVSRFDVSPYKKMSLEKIMNGCCVFRDYFDYYIFGYNNNTFYYDSGADFIGFLRRDRISRVTDSLYIKYFAMVLPVLIAFAALWIYCASKQKGRRRLPYIAFACIMLALFPELFISSDVPRWMSMTLACQFSLLFAVYLRGDKTVGNVFGGTAAERTALLKRVSIVCAAVYIGIMLAVGIKMPMFF